MIESENNSKFYDLNSYILTSQIDNKNQLFHTDIEPINDSSNHYFCTKCLKFPFIKFCKDRKNIRLTCSCINNKKILIEDLFSFESKYNLFIKDNNIFTTTIISDKNNNEIIEKNSICNKHNKEDEGFSIKYMDNYCQFCFKDEIDYIIHFNDIKKKKMKTSFNYLKK